MNNNYYVFLKKCSFIVCVFTFSYCSILLAQPIQTTTQYQQSRQLLARGNYEQAVNTLKQLIRNPTHSSAAMVEVGKIRIKQAENEMSSALAHFNEAANSINAGLETGELVGPDMPKTLYDLGRIYEERIKNYFQAAKTFEKLILAHPDFMSIDKVYFHLATCYEEMGMQDKAVENYTKIVEDYQYSTFIKVAQAKMKKLAIGTPNEEFAIDAQKSLIEETDTLKDEALASIDLGDMQAKAGSYNKAKDAYENAAAATSEPEIAVKAYRKLIDMMNEKQKDYEGAAQAVEDMANRFPNYPGNEEYIYKLGRIYETDIDSMKSRVVDGRILYRKSTENVEKAIKYYDTVTEKYPDADVSGNAYLRKGELYEKDLKDYDKARNAYNQFLQNFPTRPEAREIREKLKSLEGY